MGKQFVLWFVAALIGGLLLLSIGTYLGIGGLPPQLSGLLTTSQAVPATATSQAAPDGDAPASLHVGDQVPADFALPDIHGRRQLLAQYRGRRVLLNFWATWCHPCREEMPALAAAQKAHPQARIVGIAMDDADAVRTWLAKTPVDYPIWLGLAGNGDPTARFGDRQGLLPYSVLIGADGRIRATHLGKLNPQQLQQWFGPAPARP